MIACVAAGLAHTLFSTYANPVIANVMVICTAVVVLRLKPEGLYGIGASITPSRFYFRSRRSH